MQKNTFELDESMLTVSVTYVNHIFYLYSIQHE